MRFPADVPPRNDILVDNHVPVRMRDGVTLYADVYRPTGRRASSGHPLDHALQHRAVSNRLRRGGLLRSARLRVRLPGRQGTPRVGGRLGSHSSTTRRTRTTRSSGPRSSRGPTARSPCRAARISGRTSGGRRRPNRPAWSPSSRWWPPPASITTGSRSTAAGACRSTSAGDRSGRNRGSCRTPGLTRSTDCAPFTTTRCSGICRSTRCSSWWGGTRRSTTSGWPTPTTTATGRPSTSRSGSTRSRSRCIPSAAGSTSSARGRCAATSG